MTPSIWYDPSKVGSGREASGTDPVQRFRIFG